MNIIELTNCKFAKKKKTLLLPNRIASRKNVVLNVLQTINIIFITIKLKNIFLSIKMKHHHFHIQQFWIGIQCIFFCKVSFLIYIESMMFMPHTQIHTRNILLISNLKKNIYAFLFFSCLNVTWSLISTSINQSPSNGCFRNKSHF